MTFRAHASILCVFFVFTFIISGTSVYANNENPGCRIMIVESIPTNMTYSPDSPKHPSTYDAWLWLIGNASSHINISSFYWTLRNQDVTPHYCPTAYAGENILKILQMKLKSKKISLSVVNNGPQKENVDLEKLKASGADVQFLDVERLLGAGILHTKLWIVDGIHAYLGSANMDWRSLTEVKELGVFIFNCSTLVKDLSKIQRTYHLLSGANSSIPSHWPESLYTNINKESPIKMDLYGVESQLYFGASPPPFLPPNRTTGMNSIVDIISKAKKFVYIAVMDYFPLIVSHVKGGHNTFWPVIDDALRGSAIDRQIEVHLLISFWTHTQPSMLNYLKSLVAIKDEKRIALSVKLFKVPGYKNSTIPFSRVNHNKYMVTDNVAYIGTSNWSGDYFVHTCGVGLVVEESVTSKNSIRRQLQSIFERDWNSPYAETLEL